MSSTAVDRIVDAATYVLAQGDFAGAEGLLAQALRLDPNHPGAQDAAARVRLLRTQGIAGTATPAPSLPPGSRARTTRPPTWSSGPEATAPAEGGKRPTTSPGAAASAALDLDAVRLAAQRWREGLTTPVPMAAPPASSPSGLRPLEPAAAPVYRSTTSRVASSPSTVDTPGPQRATGGPWAPTPPEAPAPRAAAVGADVEAAPTCTLLALTGPLRGAALTVTDRPVTVGRGAPALDLRDDPFAAAGHATFVVRDGALVVVDGGSASGTWHTIEGSHQLSPGDAFSAGQQRLRYLGPLDAPVERADVTLLGAQVPAASWRLEHTLVGNRPGRVWVLRGIVTLGRESQHLAFADDQALAREHVLLRPSGAGLELVDQSAGLGTWVCLSPRGERRLGAGALLRVGSTVLQLAPR